jgi:hypothetical protein
MSLLDDITARSAETRIRVHELFARHEYGVDTKTLALLAYVDLALEVHKAICLLTKAKLYGAAFALLRPVWDALLRALWINKVASAEQIEQAFHDELHFGRTGEMFEAIKGAYFSEALPPEEAEEEEEVAAKFFSLLRQEWKATSSYTHLGGLQLSRRFAPNGELKPSYSDAEVFNALRSATDVLIALMQTFFVSTNRQPEAQETLTLFQQYHADLTERLRGHST